jgi:hypothetical protein
MKCFTSRALHLILRVLVQITSLLWKATRENAKGVWGVHEAEREAVRMNAEYPPRVGAGDCGGYHPGGWGPGGLASSPHKPDPGTMEQNRGASRSLNRAEREAVRRKTLPFPHTEALVWAVTAAQRISPQGAAGTSTAGQRLR